VVLCHAIVICKSKSPVLEILDPPIKPSGICQCVVFHIVLIKKKCAFLSMCVLLDCCVSATNCICVFVSDIAIFVLKRDVKLQLTAYVCVCVAKESWFE